MNDSLGTLGEAIDDAHDWLNESGYDPEDYDLGAVVRLHYDWQEQGQCFVRRKGIFAGLYREAIDRRAQA